MNTHFNICRGRYALRVMTKTRTRQFSLLRRKTINVLGIETSCDDCSVAVCQYDQSRNEPSKVLLQKTRRTIHLYEKYGGIHPNIVMHEHQRQLAPLIQSVLTEAEKLDASIIDIVSVTRGPGMLGPLAVGLNTAKGLAVGLKVPLIGVHHMLGHLLAPKLERNIDFPFLSLLVSGGHTMLVYSKSLFDHEILATTLDIAVGDYLDKCARLLRIPWNGEMPAAALERYSVVSDVTEFPLHVPLSKNAKTRLHCFSFAGLQTQVEKVLTCLGGETAPENVKRRIAYAVQSIAFDHICRKVRLCMNDLVDKPISAFVCSGGVARNRYLRNMLVVMLSNFETDTSHSIPLVCPSADLCSDNASMIANAAIEMYKHGITSPLTIEPTSKWSLDALSPFDRAVYEPMSSFEARHSHLP
ncbi:hypothetical protein SJAG_00865 [Schizosaccharomyces japonicus yFS275]|uniref:N(6)-L-threonylcarbamoyladenine synthase n=1 Tax=Schizosaccharomyces japonicus (strain yFS275 / FY16936) TaxID=402676 RepID=B6JWU0_SCHJY|nr:hypothetical protein SJAG_00865 [Schizosaccharomyces japonicus yFS275]EEB05841.1 hypothetical protein SJAG_00865 [Schizosaccharomyces japonicus yFS275]